MSTRNYPRAPNYSSFFFIFLYIFNSVHTGAVRIYIAIQTSRRAILTPLQRQQDRTRHAPPAHPIATTYTYRRAGPPSYTLHPIILLPLVPTKDGQQYYIYTHIHPTPHRHNTTQSTQITSNPTQKYPKPAYSHDSKCHIPDLNCSKKIGA